MYKSFEKIVCTLYNNNNIYTPNTRYVKIYRDEFTVMIYM